MSTSEISRSLLHPDATVESRANLVALREKLRKLETIGAFRASRMNTIAQAACHMEIADELGRVLGLDGGDDE